MKNEINISEKPGINGAVPVFVAGIVAFLGIVIPYVIIASNPVAGYKTPVFIALLIISALGVSTVRHVQDTTIKSLLYLVMGFTVFWIVGASYHGSYAHLKLLYPSNPPYFKIFNFDFIPVAFLAMANAITVLVALIDGRKNGRLFGTMGLAAILFSIASIGLEFVNSKPDVLLILIVLWALLASSWIKFLAVIIDDISVPVEKRFFKVLKGALYTVPIYILIGLITYYALTGSSTSLDTFSLSLFITTYKADLIKFAISTGYYYLLPNVILVLAIFTVFEFSLQAFNMSKKITEDGTVEYFVTEKKPKKQDVKKEYDPFEDIIKEMSEFKKEFSRGKINRIVAAQKIGTLREQLDFLNSKYDIGSKAKAMEVLKHIERESEFAFK